MLFCCFLPPLFDDHECAYACVSLSFVWKWNKSGFVSNRFMQERYSAIYINTKNNSKIDFSYSNDWYGAGYWDLINGVYTYYSQGIRLIVWFLIIEFAQIICDCDYYIICLLCGNWMLLHYSMLSTGCIEIAVCSIRYLNSWKT